MAKKIVGYIKLQIPAGKATPSPPVGPALGQRGLNIMAFVKEFNALTQTMEPGMPVPVVITAFGDRSFTFITKTPPNSYFLKKAAKIDKGSTTVGKGPEPLKAARSWRAGTRASPSVCNRCSPSPAPSSKRERRRKE